MKKAGHQAGFVLPVLAKAHIGHGSSRPHRATGRSL